MSTVDDVGNKLEESEELPIKSFKREIIDAIISHQIIICLGETGSGKLIISNILNGLLRLNEAYLPQERPRKYRNFVFKKVC